MKRLMVGLWLLQSDPCVWAADQQSSPLNEIPFENREKGTMPSLQKAEDMLRALTTVLEKNDAAATPALFFPREAFLRLKAMKGAANYYDQLVKWFVADVAREHKKLGDKTGWVFDGFHKGSCVWKEKGSEYNDVAYWSCYRSHFFLKRENDRVKIDLKAMINWGDAWYITHLGPIPKS